MDVATGTTISDDTIKAPTVLDAMDTVIAVRITKMKLITSTLMPDSFALSSSKDMCISSLYKKTQARTTVTLTTITIKTSSFEIATILPNRKLLKEVIFFINPDKTPASPTPAEVIIAIDTSV